MRGPDDGLIRQKGRPFIFSRISGNLIKCNFTTVLSIGWVDSNSGPVENSTKLFLSAEKFIRVKLVRVN